MLSLLPHAVQVTSSVNNLIIGKLYVDHSGIMRIRNTQSNLTARLKFHDAGMFNAKDAHLVLPCFACGSSLSC